MTKFIAKYSEGYGDSQKNYVLGEFSSKESAAEELCKKAKSRDNIVRGETDEEVVQVLLDRDFYMCGWSSMELEIEEVEK